MQDWYYQQERRKQLEREAQRQRLAQEHERAQGNPAMKHLGDFLVTAGTALQQRYDSPPKRRRAYR